MNKLFMVRMVTRLLIAGTLGLGVAQVSAQTSNPLPTPPAVATSTTSSTTAQNAGVPTPPAVTDPSGTPQAPPPPGPGGPAADSSTESGAARRLNDAYRDMGAYLTLLNNGNPPAGASALFDSAKTFYNDGLTSYNAKNYQRASYLAETSKHSVGAAKHLVQATRGTTATSVPGVTAPPTVDTTNSQDRAARELNAAYQALGNAVALNASDQAVTNFIAAGKDAYTAALSDYNAQKYDASSERAHAAHDAADAAINAVKAASTSTGS